MMGPSSHSWSKIPGLSCTASSCHDMSASRSWSPDKMMTFDEFWQALQECALDQYDSVAMTWCLQVRSDQDPGTRVLVRFFSDMK
eukprot:756440-Hanusia_phi.AAC.2